MPFLSFYFFFFLSSLAWLPVHGLCDRSTAWLSGSSRVSVSFFAAVDASSKWILAQIIPVQRWRRFAALLLSNMVIPSSHRSRNLVRATVRCGVLRGAWRSFGRISIATLLVHQRDVLVYHVILHISWPAVVGLGQLRDGATARAFTLPFVAGRAQFSHQFPERFPYLIFRMAGTSNTKREKNSYINRYINIVALDENIIPQYIFDLYFLQDEQVSRWGSRSTSCCCGNSTWTRAKVTEISIPISSDSLARPSGHLDCGSPTFSAQRGPGWRFGPVSARLSVRFSLRASTEKEKREMNVGRVTECIALIDCKHTCSFDLRRAGGGGVRGRFSDDSWCSRRRTDSYVFE